MTTRIYNHDDRLIGRWLTLCAVTIFGVYWWCYPSHGVGTFYGRLAPHHGGGAFIDRYWVYLFDQYKLYPEYQLINQDMTIGEFKQIFWFEYLHRMLGRLIGLMFFIPFVVFLWMGKVRASLEHLFTLLILGGCQGLMGWYMVKSGLVDRPDVSRYRLTAHLGLACHLRLHCLVDHRLILA